VDAPERITIPKDEPITQGNGNGEDSNTLLDSDYTEPTAPEESLPDDSNAPNESGLPGDTGSEPEIQNTSELVTSETTTSEESVTSATTEAVTTEAIEDVVQGILDNRGYDKEDYNELYNVPYSVATKLNRSIVRVVSVENDMDWFDQPYEKEGETSGLIYSKTKDEILILTDADSIYNADDIRVSFSDGKTCQGVLRKSDAVTNMAVVAVSADQFDEDYLNRIDVAALGNSYMTSVGDPLIAVGNPFGYTYSISYGIVCSMRNIAQAVDWNFNLIHTNILESQTGAGFLVNMQGAVVGFITKQYEGESMGNVVTAIAISDLKSNLERLSNGQELVYFGVIGQDVTPEISVGLGLPLGIYVSEAVANSPAYMAGIQSGDVIVAFGEEDVRTMRTFRNLLDSHQEEDAVIVRVMRQSRDEYKEITFTVVLGVAESRTGNGVLE
jgi:S1-C subfamily serine protease